MGLDYFVKNGFMLPFASWFLVVLVTPLSHNFDHSGQIGEQGWVFTIVLPVAWSTVLVNEWSRFWPYLTFQILRLYMNCRIGCSSNELNGYKLNSKMVELIGIGQRAVQWHSLLTWCGYNLMLELIFNSFDSFWTLESIFEFTNEWYANKWVIAPPQTPL